MKSLKAFLAVAVFVTVAFTALAANAADPGTAVSAKALKGKRNQVTLATKFGVVRDRDGSWLGMCNRLQNL